MALVLDAPAKLNLYLAVLGRRADGYHDVETILHEVGLRDTLVAEQMSQPASDPIELVVASDFAGGGTGLPVATGSDNLVCRAARRFFDTVQASRGVRFHLTKRIPAGGGLGGGSSDAAAALHLLNVLCGSPLDDAALHAVASALGADVPFFLRGGTQLGRGIGTDLTPLEGQLDLHFALILPPTGTSTRAVYKNHAAHLTPRTDQTSIPHDEVPAVKEIAVATGFPNDLEASALQLHPHLSDLRDKVVALGCPQVRMSGSGSSFFVACTDEAQCSVALEKLAPMRRDGVALLQTSTSHSQRRPRPGSFPGIH